MTYRIVNRRPLKRYILAYLVYSLASRLRLSPRRLGKRVREEHEPGLMGFFDRSRNAFYEILFDARSEYKPSKHLFWITKDLKTLSDISVPDFS